MKKLALLLVMTIGAAPAQTRPSHRQSESSSSTSTPVFARGHGFPGRSRGPQGQSPVTNLLTLLYENVNSAEAMANVRKMWENNC
jgi:hypothetical protein